MLDRGKYGTELKIYEFLRIVWLRNLLFRLEKIRKGTKGQWNRNYHLSSRAPGDVGNFQIYLIYNAFIHILSSVLLAAAQIADHMLSPGWDWYEIPIAMMMLLNLWCLMLQRYTHLRILRVSELHGSLHRKRTQIMVRTVCEKGVRNMTDEQLEAARSLVARLMSGQDTYLSTEDVPSLKHLAKLASEIPAAVGKAAVMRELPIDQLACHHTPLFSPKGTVERRAEKLLALLKQKQYIPRRPKAVVTRSRHAEDAYIALLGAATGTMRRKLAVLDAALELEKSNREDLRR